MKLTGRRTEISEREAARTALKTSLAPFRTDSLSEYPIRRYRSMFSATTIESSTTIPTATMSARSETRLKLNPASLYRTGAAERAIGMARMTETAVLIFPRKSRQTIATTMAVMMSSR